MAQLITVEMPWLDPYQATLLYNCLETDLDIQTATRRSPLPVGVSPEYGGIPHQAVLSALISANGGKLKNRLYETEVAATGPTGFRLNWYDSKDEGKSVRTTVTKAQKSDKAIELKYMTDIMSPKAVKPLKIFEWGFRGATHEGPRNYRWDRILSAAAVSKDLPQQLMVMEVKVRGFGLRKRFTPKLVKVGYRDGERLTREISAYDFVTG